MTEAARFLEDKARSLFCCIIEGKEIGCIYRKVVLHGEPEPERPWHAVRNLGNAVAETMGPFKTFDDACEALVAAHRKTQAKAAEGHALRYAADRGAKDDE